MVPDVGSNYTTPTCAHTRTHARTRGRENYRLASDMCIQLNFKSAGASAHSDQNPRCPPDEFFGRLLSIERSAKRQIRLHGRAG